MTTETIAAPKDETTGSVPPRRKTNRLVAGVVGVVIGVLIGMAVVTVNSTGIKVGINDNAFPKTETVTVQVFGVPVHTEAFSYDKEALAQGTGGWHGTVQVWAIGITVLFGFLGAALVIAGAEIKNQWARGVA